MTPDVTPTEVLVADDRSIVDVIEEVLELPLTSRGLRHASGISPVRLQQLALALEEHHRGDPLPLKGPDHLRPVLSTNAAQGWSLGLDYVFGQQHFVDGRYVFDPAAKGAVIGPNAKRFLLYAHSLAFVDPLPYMLDYFRSAPEGENARARMPAVFALLGEYATVRELLDQRILIPLAMHADDLIDGYVSAEEQATLTAHLPGLDAGAARIVASYLRTEQARVRRLGNRVDLFLPSTDQVPVLRELMRMEQAKFTSSQLREPFGAAVLATVTGINPEALTLADIVRMRRDDEAFENWRRMLRSALGEFHAAEGEYTDLQGELAAALRRQAGEWSARLAEKKRGSSVLAQALEGGRSIAVGVTAGALSGLMAGGGTGGLVGAAVGAIVQPAIETLLKAGAAIRAKPTVTALRHHFLALGVDAPL